MWWSRTAIPRSVLRPPLVRRGAPPPCATPRRPLSRPLRRLLSGPHYARGWYGAFRGSARLLAGWRRNPGRGAPGGAGCSLFLFIPGFQVVLGVRERAWTAENLGVVFLLVFHAIHDLRLFTGGGWFVRLFLWQAEEVAHHIYVIEAGLGGRDLPLLFGDTEVSGFPRLAYLVFEVPDHLFGLVLELLYTVLAQIYLRVELGLPGPRGGLQLGDVYTRRLERPTYDAHSGRSRHVRREVPDDLGGPLDGESVRRQAFRVVRPRHTDLLGGVDGGPLALGAPPEHPGEEALSRRAAILVHLADILSVAGRVSTRRVTSSSPWRK